MNLDQSRLLLLAAPTTPLWTGVVTAWNVANFDVYVTTVSGAYPDDIENLLLVHRDVFIARIKSRSGDVLTLAETPVQFIETYPVEIYAARLPWPRYQYIDEGIVYKDRDIVFPTPWQREMPPTAILRARLSGNDWGEAIYCSAGATIYLDASTSYGNLDDAAPLTYAWTPGAGGTITGSGATVTCAYATAGFRYLKLVVTDAHGTTSNRYLPVWVGDALAVAAVTSARARWAVNSGWTVDLELQSAATLLQYGQALLVDLETQNALFFGYIVPNSQGFTFETTTHSLTLQSALAFSQYVHAYPFLVTAVTGATTPSEWAEMYDPTLARALWYLLFWHSTLPEVVNCDLSSAPLRPISGQEFTLGNVPQQVEAVLKSAFWQARGAWAGGFVVNADPLYLDSGDWAALSGLDLSDPADVRGTLRRDLAIPQYSQARLGGVYRGVGGGFDPIIIQSPIYPGPWGAPTEISGLAPEDVYEIIDWAVRFITVANTSDTWSLEPGLAVDPAATWVVDLPNSERISIEQADFAFDTDSLRWQHNISGRDYGHAIGSATSVPQPPDIVYPLPGLPPLLPPFLPPLPPFPLDVPVAVAYGPQVQLARSLDADPIVWEDITGDLPLGTVFSLVFVGNVLFAAGDEGLYRCADISQETPLWTALAAPSGYAYGVGPGMRCMPQRRGSQLLLNVYQGADCYAWIVDADGDTLTAPFYVGTQALPATQHLSWYDDGHVLAGHSALDPATGNVEEYYRHDLPNAGKVLEYEAIGLEVPLNTGVYHYVLITMYHQLESYNSWSKPYLETLTAKAKSSSTAYAVWDASTGAWVQELEFANVVQHPDKTYTAVNIGQTFFIRIKYGTTLERVTARSESYVAYIWQINRVRVAATDWAEIGSGPTTDPLYAYHVVVPLGYSGAIEDLFFTVCDSVTCDDESNCCATTGDVRHCPAWATMPLVNSLNAGLLGFDGANILFTPALTPCEDEAAGLGTAEISPESQGRNIIVLGTVEVAVSADLTELEISADGFETISTVALPAYIGDPFPACASFADETVTLVLVYGTDGVAGYSLDTETWTDLTGDLVPGALPGAFATITAGGVA